MERGLRNDGIMRLGRKIWSSLGKALESMCLLRTRLYNNLHLIAERMGTEEIAAAGVRSNLCHTRLEVSLGLLVSTTPGVGKAIALC